MKRWYALGTLLMIIGIVVGVTDNNQDGKQLPLAMVILLLGVVILVITAFADMDKHSSE